MKKTVIFILAVLLLFSVNRPVLAEEDMVSVSVVGIDLPVGNLTESINGFLTMYPIGAVDADHHVYGAIFLYYAIPRDEAVELLYSSSLTEEEMNKVSAAEAFMSLLLSTDTEMDADALSGTFMKELGLDFSAKTDEAELVGKADGYIVYYVPADNEDYLSAIDEEFASEYRDIEAKLEEIVKSGKVYAPEDPAKRLVGQKLAFTTTDLDGNTVTSEDLFSPNEITMVNCWGTWCPNCVDEMAELAEIHIKIQEKGCGIVGLEMESDWSDGTIQAAKEMMQEYGTNYPNAILPDSINEQLTAFPTTFFVNKEGIVLGVPIIGAYVDRYESTLDSYLNAEDAAPEEEVPTEEAVPAVNGTAYNVYVMDEEGPVEGVAIQFCDDSTCSIGKTDADGLASFEMPAGTEYEVHVLTVPEEYQEDANVYHTLAEYSDVTIHLQKK